MANPNNEQNGTSPNAQATSEAQSTGAAQAAAPTVPTPGPVAADSMQDQASGMIALDVESFANGFMQIMLSGIGWASGEIAKTKGADGTDELKVFTDALSNDLPDIIQKINSAAKGTLETSSSSGGANGKAKKQSFFS